MMATSLSPYGYGANSQDNLRSRQIGMAQCCI